MAIIKRSRPASIHTKKQQLVLIALEKAARQLGLKISTGRTQYAGLPPLKGGGCLLNGEKWLVLNRALPFEELIDIYRQVLCAEDLAACGLPEEERNLLSPYILAVADKRAA